MEEKKVYIAISIEVDEGEMMPSDLLGVFTTYGKAYNACLHDADYLAEVMGPSSAEVISKDTWEENHTAPVVLFRLDDEISGMNYHIVEIELDKVDSRFCLENLY